MRLDGRPSGGGAGQLQAWERLVIRGGRVIDPSRGVDEVCDVVVEAGRIAAIGRGLGPELRPAGGEGSPATGAASPALFGGIRLEVAEGVAVIDATGLLVLPGFIDLHCHLRTPGQEWKEDIVSGTRAAAAGGFTTVCCMPNTEPPLDNGAMIEFVRGRAAAEGVVRVLPIGCITRGRQGEALAEIGEMAAAGVVAISDDGSSVTNPELMRCALQYARMFGVPVSVHAEDPQLAAGGVVHLGRVAAVLGLRGQPAEAEAAMVARDILLASLTGGRLHVAHVSSALTVELIREAKRRGIAVTAEVTPHHLTLTEDAVEGFDTNAKCSPPLRTEEDRLALIAALADGTIDAIATDHAPHHRDDKEVEFDHAAFGISGLETAFSLVMTELVDKGLLGLQRAVECLTAGPARAFGPSVRGAGVGPGIGGAWGELDGGAGSLAPGGPADLVIADPAAEWVVDPERFFSKGKNTPFAGKRLKGKILLTLVGGRVAYQLEGVGTPTMAGDKR